MSGVNRVNFNSAPQQRLDSHQLEGRQQDHLHTDHVGNNENSHGGKHVDCDESGKKHCHGNNGHHKQIEELAQIVIAQMQAAAQAAAHQAMSDQISQSQQRLNEPTPAELDRSPAKIEKLIYEAKMTRGVDQGQALRELDQLTGAQAATDALMRSIV